MVYAVAAYSITLGVLALYGVLLTHRSRVAALALARAGVGTAADPQKGFNVGAALLAPFWLWVHGQRLAGVGLLAAWGVLIPMLMGGAWGVFAFVVPLPFAAGAALGFVGHRIARAHRGDEDPLAYWSSQLPWAVTGIVVYAFVAPWIVLGLLGD